LGDKPVALVTGATSGIGQATCHRLRDRGYRVFAVGRNPDALELLRSRGLDARAVDVTEEAAVTMLVREIEAEHGAVDVLVNNAGYGLSGPLEQVALADLRSLLETNVVAVLRLCQAVLPAMRCRGSGTIVNLGSTAGRFTTPGAGAYHISKYGLSALSLGLAAEVRQWGVRVVLIEPTGVRATNFIANRVGPARRDPGDDPYAEFKRRYDRISAGMAKMPVVTVTADTVAAAVVRAVENRDPKPRYVVGLSGKASVAARRLLTDRMWDRILMTGLKP